MTWKALRLSLSGRPMLLVIDSTDGTKLADERAMQLKRNPDRVARTRQATENQSAEDGRFQARSPASRFQRRCAVRLGRKARRPERSPAFKVLVLESHCQRNRSVNVLSLRRLHKRLIP